MDCVSQTSDGLTIGVRALKEPAISRNDLRSGVPCDFNKTIGSEDDRIVRNTIISQIHIRTRSLFDALCGEWDE